MSKNANNLLLMLLFVLNFVDALFTLTWVRLGLASEANPLMEPLVHSPPVFIAIKVALVALCCVLLYRYSHLKIAQRATVIGVSAYLGVLGLHANFVFELCSLPMVIFPFPLQPL